MIRFDNVSKLYGRDTVALEKIDLDIEDGEFVFLVGQSGSGKSTMIRLLLKEMEPTAGAIYVRGQKLSSVPRRKIPRHRQVRTRHHVPRRNRHVSRHALVYF